MVQNGFPIESGARFILATALLLYIFWYGTVFEAVYPKLFVDMYAYPWWLILLISIVLVITAWCPRLGAISALAILLYVSDMNALTTHDLTASASKKKVDISNE